MPEPIAPIEPAAPVGAAEPADPVELVEIERRVLAALCSQTGDHWVRERMRQSLAGHRWHEPVHQIVYEIVMSLPAAGSKAWRQHLPAWLTRRGFPDFDLASLFNAPPLSPREAERLVAQLKRSR